MFFFSFFFERAINQEIVMQFFLDFRLYFTSDLYKNIKYLNLIISLHEYLLSKFRRQRNGQWKYDNLEILQFLQRR